MENLTIKMIQVIVGNKPVDLPYVVSNKISETKLLRILQDYITSTYRVPRTYTVDAEIFRSSGRIYWAGTMKFIGQCDVACESLKKFWGTVVVYPAETIEILRNRREELVTELRPTALLLELCAGDDQPAI